MKKLTVIALVSILLLSMLAACGMPSTGASEPPASAASQAPADTAAAGTGEMVTLRVVDWDDSSLARREVFHAEYKEKVNPSVDIEYTMLTTDQFKNTVVTMIKSGDAPDLFPIPSGMKLPTALAEGWYVPINDYVPADFTDRFEESAFMEGVNKIGDDIYCPPQLTAMTDALFYYNKDLLEEAGVDVPKTYTEFIDACKAITEKGAGQYYGIIEGGQQLNRFKAMLNAMAGLAGGRTGGQDIPITVNGRAPFDTEAMIGAVGLLDQLAKDGSFHPDTLSISAPEAREIFGQGQAAFICQGNWCIGTWNQNNPDLNYGVMAPPVPDDGAKGSIPMPQPNTWLGIYRQSKLPEYAGEYLDAIHSEEYVKGNLEDGQRITPMKDLNDQYITNEHMKEYYTIAAENTLVVPFAAVRDEKVNDFFAAVTDVSPGIGDIAQGVIAGSIPDYRAALATLTDATTAEWQRACEEAGVDYSVFEFPNWDPTKPYTDADYAALP